MILARVALEAALVRSLRAIPKTQTYKLPNNWSPGQVQWLQINKRLASSIIKETTEGAGAESAAKNLKSRVAGGVKTLPQVDEPLETAMSPSRTRALRKKRLAIDELSALGFLNTRGYTTADEYNLEELHAALKQQNLYETKRFFSTDNLGVEQNVLFVTAKYPTGEQPREIFFFREGSVVFWNCNDIETNNVLNFLRNFERESYVSALVHGESEMMPYTYISSTAVDVEGDLVADSSDLNVASRAFFQNGKFYVTPDSDNFLYKYTFSNAIAQSIKLGIWEATLDRYIDSMEYLTEDLKRGRRLRISRAAMLRKTGELFALRHSINLSSDLLDAPDFYWDREELEGLYLQVCSYFSISRRTKVMNEKINHCVELAELVSHNLNDAHHIRLEWMIIILIMVEVGFEILHFAEGALHHGDQVIHSANPYPISENSA
ncbi:required for meiotic nuclear division protein 1 homolog [Drosophila innubila]|uniref:required for meiotic nuclear division protein 1 homolog n=1 Tax=Drosophila innubila TaxID=198719 RepID=UPI00148CCE71|nr:required for meiotic nuclear division protein 1 homolog [Drosophila innubila]